MPKGATEVGSAYVSIYPDTSHFEDDLNTELSQVNMQGVGKKAGESFQAGFSPVTVAIGNLLSSAVEGAVNMFSQNLQRGIERLDTIQNFPRLMQTFGYATDDADASVRAIQEHLDGLPGTTDEVLRLVQALSDSTGSLDLATSTGLAFNDMLTASGADAYTSMYAMRMFDQMMGGAAYSAQRWQGIVSKMPLQMNLVAESLLGAGANSAQLGDALKDGEVSMQDLARAMSELGPEFEIQARAMSYGVGTAMRNVQNRTGMGVAAILEGIGQRQIANVINDFSYGVRDAMYAIGEGVEWLRRKILVSGIGVLFSELVEKIKTAVAGIDWQPLKDALSAVIDAIHTALQWALDNGETIVFILGGVAGAIAAILAFDLGTKIGGLITSVGTLFTTLMANPLMLIVGSIAALVGGLIAWFTQTEEGREEWRKLTEAFRVGIDNIKAWWDGFSDKVSENWSYLVNTISGAIDAISAAWEGFVNFCLNLVYGIRDGILAAVDLVVQAWNAGAELLGIVAAFVGDTIAAIFNVVGAILETATDAWDTFWTFVDWVCQGVVDVILAVVNAAIDGAKSFVKDTKNTVNKIKNLVDTFKRNLKTTWSNIKTTIENVWNGIRNFFSGVWDRIKSIFTSGAEGSTSPATSKFIDFRSKVEDIFNGIKTAATTIWNGIRSAIDAVVNAIKSLVTNGFNAVKTTTETVWNAIKTAITHPIEAAMGVVDAAIGGIQGIINTLTGKRVDVGVNDNRRQVNTVVNDIQRSINSVQGKRVSIEYYGFQSGIRGVDVTTYTTAAGNKRIVAERIPLRMAAGGIVTEATAAIFGEAGDEAVIPLSNRNKVRPFAKAVAAEIGSKGVTVTGNNFYVRNDDDIRRIAQEIVSYGNRQTAGRL